MSYLLARNTILMAAEYGGKLAALQRALRIILSSVWQTTSGRDRQHISYYRMRGVLDYYRQRFGPPPPL